MSSKQEETLRFFQYVEDSGLRAYNGLLAQNLDHMWNEKNRTNSQEKNDKKRKQEEAIKRTREEEEVVTEGKHLRMGSIAMPAPVDHVTPRPCTTGFTVRSQSLHSVGTAEEEGSPTSRKQPPPKPRRDPNTKLSISCEAVDQSPSSCRGGDLEKCDAAQGCSEDCKRIPPPKPKRNPNTQLSTSFDESYIRTHGSKGSPPAAPHSQETVAPSPPQPQSPSRDSDLDEPVYIEMSGHTGRELPQRASIEDEEPGEAVYEEMKYPVLDEPDSVRWDPPGCRSQCPTPCPPDPDIHTPLSRCSTPRGTPLCDIPAPFPNLLSHRPPLLVFPPAPAQCSPNSDESPLTPLDVAKLPMLENSSYGKSPTSSSSLDPSSSSSSSSSHLRRAERELTATPTITVSGRSSAPPLPCTLYKSSASSAHSYQRSHSACPSPVSMGRCLTPLSLMRAPPFDGPFPGLPRSASATPHGKGSPPQDGRHHGSLQNVSVGRSRTPTSPLDELTNLFNTGRNMLKKNSSGRKSKEPAERATDQSQCRSCHSVEPLPRRDSKERCCNSVEPSPDSKERGCNSIEPISRHDSKDRGCSITEALHRQDSKERGCSNVEPLPRRDSKDRGCTGPELLPRQESKELHSLDVRQDGRDRSVHCPELLPRHDSKDTGRTGLEYRRDSKDGGRNSSESRRDVKDKVSAECRRDGKDRASNGTEIIPRRELKDKGGHAAEALLRYDGKDRTNFGMGSPKAHERDTGTAPLSVATPSRHGRSPVSPTMTTGNSSSELKTIPKSIRSPSMSVVPSPAGTPQRQSSEIQQVPPMTWMYGDSTMLEMIERKQRLCREIRSRQWPLNRSPCKQESLPSLPTWKKTNGTKKYLPPPYPTQTTVFWDTAI
ncbi:neuronal tyrosine-phosphorylated phosphoinositide-3-kinase adapter 2 [Chanos chanos]|uniref:Neuronal tyrosine-phosphorylated phosphoinositide-3-kinase adapter 2 n=1 Tax=Chanos chanos TaxID=29144 RepID=A0A6J2VH54_CHACN|nr:neuronal tyrosine-phosphorylated phosphoinositide-3-kinase adapter 2-like [Chanos chanos]